MIARCDELVPSRMGLTVFSWLGGKWVLVVFQEFLKKKVPKMFFGSFRELCQ